MSAPDLIAEHRAKLDGRRLVDELLERAKTAPPQFPRWFLPLPHTIALVPFHVDAIIIDPFTLSDTYPRFCGGDDPTPFADRVLWRERRILAHDEQRGMYRVLSYYLHPIEVPCAWVREVPR